ncbi:Galacturonosyltransferase [Datura stramonium]|uniref:Hexosyltransferase n=1 Tax=Datura stramonium TaxID=4076 RepID=A0ABS8SDR2_DATST|nr:Galacturonosyltransferase [Datura stramonium]
MVRRTFYLDCLRISKENNNNNNNNNNNINPREPSGVVVGGVVSYRVAVDWNWNWDWVVKGIEKVARLVKDFVKILIQVNSEEVPAGLKLPESLMEKSEREIRESKFAELMNKHFAASAIPKGIHLSTDNILAASVVVNSAVQSSLKPEKIVFHVITDKKTYAGMHSWFALNPVTPALVEVKGVHQFDWLTRKMFQCLKQLRVQGYSKYYHEIMLQLFPNLDKVAFLDDDVVIQRDLSPCRDIDLSGKVNGAVETCGRRILINTYHAWLKENLKSNLTMWKLGTLPPALIAFKGYVHPIDASWHMLGLGYQNNTNVNNEEGCNSL